MIFGYSYGRTRVVLARAGLLIALIAIIDWRVDLNLSFGFLYIFPILLAGAVLSRRSLIFAALFCTLLSDYFDPFPITLRALPEDILLFAALAGAGFYSYETARSRRREAEHLTRVEREAAARREAEEQLEFLIDSSPAAIFTMTATGDILRANAAAYGLLAAAPETLVGKHISAFLPALGCVPSPEQTHQTFRTEMQCRGERSNREPFLANVFFSTYKTAIGPRLAALVVDASEELREREEANLEQLLAGSRILVSAVSHEIRNVCGAIAVVHENLARAGTLRGNKDFEALGALVETLNHIASLELRQAAGRDASPIDLAETLDELRIVLEPCCAEAGIEIGWSVPAALPQVLADRRRLLQVLLNLTKNSERALEHSANKRIEIAVSHAAASVAIRITDSGPGIGSTDALFQPFQKGAEATGLGLYLSRAFVRSFRGELRHDASVPGCSFVIELPVARAAAPENRQIEHETHPTAAAR